MPLSLYDSAQRAVTALEPLAPGRIGLYVCGPTTQGGPHLGHLRTFLAVDVLVRWLRRTGYDVTVVRNVTDIDDKILDKSGVAGEAWWAWSYRYEREFSRALNALGALEPTYEPRATGHVPEMIALIARLIDAGHAYAAGNGNVYFDVHSFSDYGDLTRQALEDLQEAEDGDAPGKRDPRDFALWKAPKPGEPADAAWDTPWGRGRPGWHLECSAMARRYLGETFDIHAGGLDLRFPHHENEQAQSRAAGYGFARRWLHAGVLTVDGLKMGKSLDNFVTAERALAEHPAPVLRLALTHTHYRATVEYNAATVAEMTTVWERFRATSTRAADQLAGADGPHPLADPGADPSELGLPVDFVAAMDDDLNAAEAFAVIHRTAAELNTALGVRTPDPAEVARGLGALRGMLDVFGVDPLGPRWGTSAGDGDAARGALDRLVTTQLTERTAARDEKDWARADRIRDALADAGIAVEDGADGARWTLREGR